MRPVELQPAVVQAPNVERIQQQQQNQPQITQQTFAGQLERIASERPSQVQSTQPGREPKPGDVLSEDRGERSRRKPSRRKPGKTASGTGGDETLPPPGSIIDVRV